MSLRQARCELERAAAELDRANTVAEARAAKAALLKALVRFIDEVSRARAERLLREKAAAG